MLPRVCLFSTLLLTLLAIGCESRTPTSKGCTPGATVACACQDGRNGAQTCVDDGSRFGTCRCSDPVAQQDAYADTSADVQTAPAAIDADALDVPVSFQDTPTGSPDAGQSGDQGEGAHADAGTSVTDVLDAASSTSDLFDVIHCPEPRCEAEGLIGCSPTDTAQRVCRADPVTGCLRWTMDMRCTDNNPCTEDECVVGVFRPAF